MQRLGGLTTPRGEATERPATPSGPTLRDPELPELTVEGLPELPLLLWAGERSAGLGGGAAGERGGVRGLSLSLLLNTLARNIGLGASAATHSPRRVAKHAAGAGGGLPGVQTGRLWGCRVRQVVWDGQGACWPPGQTAAWAAQRAADWLAGVSPAPRPTPRHVTWANLGSLGQPAQAARHGTKRQRMCSAALFNRCCAHAAIQSCPKSRATGVHARGMCGMCTPFPKSSTTTLAFRTPLFPRRPARLTLTTCRQPAHSPARAPPHLLAQRQDGQQPPAWRAARCWRRRRSQPPCLAAGSRHGFDAGKRVA